MSFCNSVETEILANIRAKNLEVSLHTGDPGEDGSANEVVGGLYARLPATFAAPVGNTMLNNILLRWDGMPAVTVTHFVVREVGGPGQMYGPMDDPVPLLVGQSFEIPSGDLILSTE